MKFKTNIVTFNYTKRGEEAGVEIVFSESNNIFWSCQHGTDLFDFDALLERLVPNIDFEKINYSIAHWWEQELYRLLSKCKNHKSRIKALLNFCKRIGKRYRKKQRMNLKNKTTENLLSQLEESINDKIRLFRKDCKVSGRNYWGGCCLIP